MLNLYQTIKNIWFQYSLSTISIVLYFICIVWLCYFKGEKRKNFQWFGICTTVIIVLLQSVMYFSSTDDVGDWFIFMLPMGIVISYVGTLVIRKYRNIHGSKKTWILVVCYAIIIQSAISLKYTEATLDGGFSHNKATDTVGWIAEALSKSEIDDVYVLAPDEIATQIQEVNPEIRVFLDKAYRYVPYNVEQLLIDMDILECNCLIVPQAYDNEEIIKMNGYRQLLIYDGYSVYLRT